MLSLAHAKVLTIVIVNDTTGMMTIEVGWSNDEIGHIKGEKAFAIETARIALGQHKGLADRPIGIDMAEIGTRKKAVVTTGTQHQPTGVGAPIMERFCIIRVGSIHRAALSCREIE